MAKKVKTYKLKFPHKGGNWHKVRATSALNARKKFVKGSKYKPYDVKLKTDE